MELIYRGSVKDLYKKNDHLVFDYSNRYSIFDWGEMPNEIPRKGEALASMAASFFDYLLKKGIPSHFIGTSGSHSIEVQSVAVHRPQWVGDHYDYSFYKTNPTHCLVPLEVIFRKFLGQGNSLEGRLKKNPSYLQDLGLAEIPTSASSFTPPLVEFSTKLEATDRYLTRQEIQEMNILSDNELQNLRSETQKVAMELDGLFASFGVKFWDGKLEFSFGEKEANGMRSLLLVDSIGPDELRLTYEGLPLSKEFLRQIYASSSWNDAVKKAKEIAKERKTQDWKAICRDELKETPQSLTDEQIAVTSLLYQALANEVATCVGRKKPFSEECTLKLWHQRAQKVLETSI
ncbi:MAG: phosphoribosylaminoimidazolesuccinocarboxamide synthase [Pseudobdellovibrionaceae bacterium]